jgi:uridine kinase
MKDTAQDWRQAREKIHAEIQRLRLSRPAPVVVALDGPSGAGKSTLAGMLADDFQAAWIPLDDFFSAEIPDPQWGEFSLPEKLQHVFDWDRLRRSALLPLLQVRPARWHAFDFASGLQPDGTYRMEAEPKVRQPADVILVDGAYSAGPALADLVDLAVLVVTPPDERRLRLEQREDPVFLESWHQRWNEFEAYYFNQVRPQSSYDLVVKPVR